MNQSLIFVTIASQQDFFFFSCVVYVGFVCVCGGGWGNFSGETRKVPDVSGRRKRVFSLPQAAQS